MVSLSSFFYLLLLQQIFQVIIARDALQFLLHNLLHLLGIHHNLAVKNFLFDTFVEVVGHRTDKHSLRQTGNLARRNERIHLRVDGGGNILPVDGDRLPFLQHLTEPFR